MLTVYKPNNKNKRKHHHKGDTFRELIDIWEELGFVKVLEHDGNFCWLNEIGDTLLYDRPTLEWMDECVDYQLGLYGNPIPRNNGRQNTHWIFWGRHPRILHEKYEEKSLSFDERTITSIFIGKIENEVQNKYRTKHIWSDVIEMFDMMNDASSTPYKYSQTEYLNMLKKSKYGLSLRGYGPKCNREIELFALGVVPLLHTDVDVSYYNTLYEGTHFFRINDPTDVKRIIETTTKEKWEEMSSACRKWYDDNCSPHGSFKLTKQLYDNKNTYTPIIDKPKSVCTLCTDKTIKDLKLFLTSMSEYNRDTPIYLLCDSSVKFYVQSNFPSLNVKYNQILDKYSGKNRKQMEKEGIFTDFMKIKTECIDFALQSEQNTLYVDSDIVFLDVLPDVDVNKDIGLCPHYVKQYNIDNYGYFNAGMIFVNNNKFCEWWKKHIDVNSKWDDQGALDDAPEHFNHFEFDMTINFGWWRLCECNEPELRLKKIHIQQNILCYDNKRINSIHTHFKGDTFIHTVQFNDVIMKHLMISNNYDFLKTHLYKKLTMLSQYYNADSNERQKEINICFLQNLENPHIKQIINFTEYGTNIPDEIRQHSKFISVDVNNRLTFKFAVDYANEHLQDEFVCLSNADIFLDFKSDWSTMYRMIVTNNNIVYALSRTEFDGQKFYKDKYLNSIGYANAQDAWFFVPGLENIRNIDFFIGTLGCDNAFAHRLKQAGYIPLNSPNEYKIYHYDVCRNKDGANFLKIQKEIEKKNNIVNTHPEEEGYYLCPDMDMTDSLFSSIKISKIEKYQILCDLLSKKVRINNRT
jgi:hypothetical protein